MAETITSNDGQTSNDLFTYKISGDYTAEHKGNGTEEYPYILTKGTNFENITSINLNGCYAEFPSFRFHTKITSVENGYFTKTDCHEMFEYCSSLTVFKADLNTVTNGAYMFQGSKFKKSEKVVDDGWQPFFVSANKCIFAV